VVQVESLYPGFSAPTNSASVDAELGNRRAGIRLALEPPVGVERPPKAQFPRLLIVVLGVRSRALAAGVTQDVC